MANMRLHAVLRHVHDLFAVTAFGELTDRQLLQRFAENRDEAAFTTLVRRHGPLVLGAARRLLHQQQDAEDVLQATFMVLARKAAAQRWQESAAGWLYRVAFRLARRLSAKNVRRQGLERKVGTMDKPEETPDQDLHELHALLDEELNCLPNKYREPLLLCYLEGQTRDQAAGRLGWSVRTLHYRLEHGLKLLRTRLTRRGVGLPMALLTVGLSQDAASGAISGKLASAILQGSIAFAAGRGLGGGAFVVKATTMAEEAVKAMTLANAKVGLGLVLAVGMAATGAGLVAQRVPAAQEPEQEQLPAEAQNKGAGEQANKQRPRTDLYGDPLPPGALVRLGTLQLHHQDADIAFSRDGTSLVSAAWNGATMRAWDVATGKMTRQIGVQPPNFPLPQRDAMSILSPDGTAVAVFSGVGGQQLHLYNTTTGEETASLPVGLGRHELAFALDGKLLATLSGYGNKYSAALWDLSTGQKRFALDSPSWFRALAVTPDCKLLAYSAGDGLFHVWDTATARELHSSKIEARCWAFSPDSATLATLGLDGNVTLWAVPSLTKVATLELSPALKERANRHCLTFSPDGNLLACSGNEGVILCDLAARKQRLRLTHRDARYLAITPDSKTLASAGASEIRLWDVATGRQIHGRSSHDGWVSTLAVSPDGKVIASAGGIDPTIRLWQTATGRPLTMTVKPDSGVWACTFSSNGDLVVRTCHFGTGDHSLSMWDIATGKQLRRFVAREPANAMDAWHLSADGRRLCLLTGTGHPRRQLTVWDSISGQVLACRPFRGYLPSCFSADGESVTVQSRGHLTIEDTKTGAERMTIGADWDYPSSMNPSTPISSFSSDGKLLAGFLRPRGAGFTGDGVGVIEVATGHEIFHIDGLFLFMAFSPDVRFLATADSKWLRLWDTMTGAERFRLAWPEEYVRRDRKWAIKSLVLMPDGRSAVTGMDDGTALIWDLAPATSSGQERQTARLGDEEIAALWNHLAGDAAKAYRAMRILRDARTQFLSFLKERLRPIAPLDAKQVEPLLQDLDSEKFAVREAASKKLQGLGAQARPFLRDALKKLLSLEVRRRMEYLAAEPRSLALLPDELRVVRALSVVEHIGLTDARQFLEALSKGDPNVLLSIEAKKSLERLAKLPNR